MESGVIVALISYLGRELFLLYINNLLKHCVIKILMAYLSCLD